jgi:hypothetical protein
VIDVRYTPHSAQELVAAIGEFLMTLPEERPRVIAALVIRQAVIEHDVI